MSKIVVIGGGAAGMMAAGTAGARHEVILLEKNEKLGKKMFITGKGRCNFTNACEIEELIENVVTNKSFLYSAFYTFSNTSTIQLFNELGLREKVERGNRVFPQSDKSSDVIKAMSKYLEKNNVEVRLNTTVKDLLTEDGKIKGVLLENGQTIECDGVILATGGVTYSQTGSTGDGYVFAKKLGHGIIEPKGALIPLVSEDSFVKELQGLSLKNVSISLFKGNKKVKEVFGEMLFTHFGLSGPAVLSLSSIIKEEGSYTVRINLKPALDETTLDSRILRDFEKYANKSFKNALDDLLPKKMIPVIIELSGIDEYKKVNQITKEERNKIRGILQNLTVSIKGKRPINEGIITSGGIKVKEVNPATMESKVVEGLYIVGEVLDVDAVTGGFNLQIAFSTGYLAGISC